MFSPFAGKIIFLYNHSGSESFDTAIIPGGKNVNNEILWFVNDDEVYEIFLMLVSECDSTKF